SDLGSPRCTRCVHVAASPLLSWCVQSFDLAFISTPLWFCGFAAVVGRSCVCCEVIRCGGDARAPRCATCSARLLVLCTRNVLRLLVLRTRIARRASRSRSA